jgi:hypothetical protein
MEWPVAQYFGPVTIDLSGLLKELQSYNADLGFIAHKITRIDAEKLKKLKEWQNKLAEEFCNAIYESAFKGFLEQLGNQASGRIILLGIDMPGGLLEAFPWELLGNPNNTNFQKRNVIFSIHRAVETRPVTYQQGKDIDLLVLSSYPLDKTPLHPEYSVIHNTLNAHPSVRLRSEGPNLSYYQFCQHMRTNPDIVHLAVHGEPNNEGFAFVRNEGSQIIPIPTLVNFIKQIKSIKLLVLNACYSATPHLYTTYAIASMARQLVSGGLPAVIGMSTSITDRAAIEFSRWFYLELSESPTVRQAFHTTIDNLRNYNQPDSLLWSVPMLYLNDDINPFGEILREAVEKNDFWLQPRELLEETAEILAEFVRVFKRIRPDSYWNGFIWNLETDSISRIQIQTRDRLVWLREQLLSISHLASRQQVFELQSMTNLVLKELDHFIDTMPDWERLDFKAEATAKTISSFMSNGKKLTGDMENLTSRINSLLHPR